MLFDGLQVSKLVFDGLQVSKLVFSNLLQDALEDHFTTHQVHALNSGWSWKSIKFQCTSNTPENHLNGVPRPPNVSKMRSKQVPEIIKFMKKSKKRNLMKTTIFNMFLRGWDITNQLIFQSQIIKNHACNSTMLFDTPNHRKYQKVTQNGIQWGTQNPSKIIKNLFWHPPGSP